MKRIAAWALLLFGALIVLAGVIDLAIGPELAQLEPGVTAEEAGGRAPSVVLILIGVALAAAGAWLHRRSPEER